MKILTGLLLPGILAAANASLAGPGSGDFRPMGRTARVTYYAAKGQKVDIPRTEAFLSQLALVIGPLPQGWRFDYYRHASTSSVGEHSGLGALGVEGAVGVTDIAASRVDSARAFHPHELVHVVAGHLGCPPVFFAEGLAVALTAGGTWGGRDIDSVAREGLKRQRGLEPYLVDFTRQDPVVGYSMAGSFTTFLIARHGIDALTSFFRGCGTSPRTYEGAFRRAFGQSVAHATIEWERALRAGGSSPAQAWQDPETWPQSLSGALRTAGSLPTD